MSGVGVDGLRRYLIPPFNPGYVMQAAHVKLILTAYMTIIGDP